MVACPKHPSIPLAYCTCGRHRPVDAKLFTKPVMAEARPNLSRVRGTLSPHSGWSITHRDGVITVCGVCWKLATDHEHLLRDHTAKLTAFIRTNICKHCGDAYKPKVACPLRNFGLPHERRWLVRSTKVPACGKCSGKAEYEVEPEVLQDIMDSRKAGRPPEPVRIWRHALEERGLLV